MNSLSLQQQMKLQQKLSPAQIQVIRLLEVPGCELSQRVNEELQENPALEEIPETETVREDDYATSDSEEDYRNPLQNDDFNYDDYVQDDETPDYRSSNHTEDEALSEIPISAGTSFGEYLKSQIYLTKMDKPDRHIAKFIVGNIDEDGYLRRSAEELSDDIAFREGLEVTPEKIASIVLQIQAFDPPGVGAKDLQECLLIQLRQKPHTPMTEDAIAILEQCFDDFSHRRADKVRQQLNMSEEDYRDALQEITHLNPKPGSAWTGTVYDRHQVTIIPDFIVDNIDGELVVQLNQDDIPELRVSREYSEMLEGYSQSSKAGLSARHKDAVRFIKQKLDAARWFIDAIKQRNETLLRTMKAIVLMQRDFFLDGEDSSLRPLVLQDIAKLTGYDSSTISRVSNSKYVQTQYGIFPLKHFFSEKMNTTSGEEVSTREIKQVLLELIKNEDKHEPLTDDQLVQKMSEKGYAIARRTIAKYRDLFNIPTARMRRDI